MDPNVMEGVLTPQDLFNIKVDTMARWDKIMSTPNNFNVPAPNFPDYNFDTNPLDKTTQMSLSDGLFSDNAQIKQQAKSLINKDFANSPGIKYNVGMKIDTPYDEAKKYVQREYGFDPTRDNEDFYYKNTYANQSFLNRSWQNTYKGLGRLVGGVGAKLGQTVGHIGAMAWNGLQEAWQGIDNTNGGNFNNNFIADVAENTMTKLFEQAEETLKDHWMPVFKPAGWDEKGFFDKLNEGIYWSDELADGAAFMGAMIAETYLAGGLGRMAGLGKVGAKTITGTGTLAKLGRGAMKLTTGADDLGGVGSWALSVAGESMFESAGVFKGVKQTLLEERAEGKNSYSDEEIDKIAGERGAMAFKGNLAVLALSNAFENRMIFQPLMKKFRGKGQGIENQPNRLSSGIKVSDSVDNLDDFAKASSARPEYKNKLEGYWNIKKKLKDPQGALRFYGMQAIKAPVMEGLWEENAQLAIERLATQGKLNAKSFVNQYVKQTGNLENDHKAQDAIGAGAVIGILGSSGTSIATRERRKLKENTLNAIKQYNLSRQRYLSFQDAYERDTDGNFIKDEDTGGYKIDVDKAKAIIAGQDEHLAKQLTVDSIKDPIFRRLMQDQLLASYVFAAKAAGIHGNVAERFDRLSSLTAEQTRALGFDPGTVENIPAFQQSFAEQSKIYDDVFQSRVDVEQPKGVKNEEFEKTNGERKAELYGQLTTLKATQRALNDYTTLQSTNSIDNLKSPDSVFNLHYSLMAQFFQLEQFAKTLPQESTFYNDYVKNRRKALVESLQEVLGKMSELQSDGGTTVITTQDGESRNVNENKYAKYFNEKGEFIEEKLEEFEKEFRREEEDFLKHAGLQNSISQLEYITGKIADKKEGYNNFVKYKNHKSKVEDVDDAVDAETDPEEKQEQVDKEKELKELEAKKKAEEEAKKKAEEERIRKEEEEKKRLEEEAIKKAEEDAKDPVGAVLRKLKAELTNAINATNSPEDAQQLLQMLEVPDWQNNVIKNIQALAQMMEDYDFTEIIKLIKEYNELLKNPNPQPPAGPVKVAKSVEELEKILFENTILEDQWNDDHHNALLDWLKLKGKQEQWDLLKNGDIKQDRALYLLYKIEYDQKKNSQLPAPVQRVNPQPAGNQGGNELTELEKKKADIERRRQEELNETPVGSSTMMRYVKDGENAWLTSEEAQEAEDIIQAAIAAGVTDANKLLRLLQNSGFVRSSGTNVEHQRNYLKNRLSGKTNSPVNGRLFEDINKKYDAELAALENKEPEQPPVEPTEPKATLTKDSMEALEEAFRIQEQAIIEITSYEDLLRQLGFYQNENKIDQLVDLGKETGRVIVPTMKPNELKGDGSLTVSEKLYLQARFNFLQKLSDSTNKEKYQLVLYVEQKNGKQFLKGKVADKDKNVLLFDSEGNEVKDKGVEIIFDLDLISYNTDSLPKERIEAAGLKQDPLKKAMKNFQLHDSFKDSDGKPAESADNMILEYVKNAAVMPTASIQLVTQGQLVRPGITNNPNSLTDLSGKRKTLTEMQGAGEVFQNENGVISSVDSNSNEFNTFIKKGSLNVRLKRNVNNEADGFEIVEFIPNKIADLKAADGKSLSSLLQPILEKALKGELSTEYEQFLKVLINRREFLILNLGQTLLVVNRSKFLKTLGSVENATTSDLLAEKILSLTSIDELMASEFNIDSPLYERTDDYKAAASSFPDDVYDIIANYQAVVKNNVTSSAQRVKVSEKKEGVARVNKRLVVSLNQTFEDMKNDKLKKEQEKSSENNTTVEVTVTDDDKKLFMNVFNSDDEVNLEDLTETEC